MGTIRDLRNGLKKVNLNTLIVNSIDETKGALVEYNRKQLKLGQDSKGLLLSPEYALFDYALRKNLQNPLAGFGNPDLFLTGAFQRGFYATVGFTGIYTLDSSDSKSAGLERKYGSYIFGVNTQNIETYAQEIFYPLFKKKFTQQTGLLFS